VVYWNHKRTGPKLWILSLTDGTERPVTSAVGVRKLLGWSADGQWIYVHHESQGEQALFRISAASGTSERWVTLPFTQNTECTGMTTDGQSFVCAVSEGDSDAWQVEDFDGARREL